MLRNRPEATWWSSAPVRHCMFEQEVDRVAVVTERRDAPSDHELSERLAPLRRTLERHVGSGAVDGIVTLVDDGTGHPIVDRYGPDGSRPDDTRPDDSGRGALDRRLMGRRSRVPIGELTTTLTTATALLLVEDGAIDLHDPVDDLLPELADRRVLRTIGAPLDDTVEAGRPVTLMDLLESRSGIGAGPAAAPGTPVHRAARSLGIGVFDPAETSPEPFVVDEWLQRLGTLPLLHQPGERRLERTDTMVLGALVERLTGKPLPDVMADRLLAPLHLYDTSFPPAVGDDAPWGFVDAAAGMVSTLDDVWRIASMLVDGGRSGDTARVLSPSTVRSMVVGHGRPERPDPGEPHERGWGLGLRSAAQGPEPRAVSAGFGMDGTGADGSAVTWRSSPDSGATAILIAAPAGGDPQRVAALTTTFWHGIDRAGL